jgi:OmpA-OmpF porin, OOP family
MKSTSRSLALALVVIATGCGASLRNWFVELQGDRIVIHDHIQFGQDSDEILPESFGLLDRIVAVLGEHPEVTAVQVHGHTSTEGPDAHNHELSERRAAAVARYMTEHGVTQRISSRGFGEEHPLCQDDTDECNERNRRVEFFVEH